MPGAPGKVLNPAASLVDFDGWETVQVSRRLPRQQAGVSAPRQQQHSAAQSHLIGPPAPAAARSSALLRPRQPLQEGSGKSPKDPPPRSAGPSPRGKAWGEGARVKTESLLKEFLSSLDFTEAIRCLEDLNLDTKDRWHVVGTTLDFGLELGSGESKSKERSRTVALLAKLKENKWLKEADLAQGLREVAKNLPERAVDLPVAPKLLGEVVGLLASKGALGLAPALDGASSEKSFFLVEDEEEFGEEERFRLARDLVGSSLEALLKEEGEERLVERVSKSGFKVMEALSYSDKAEALSFLNRRGISGKILGE